MKLIDALAEIEKSGGIARNPIFQPYRIKDGCLQVIFGRGYVSASVSWQLLQSDGWEIEKEKEKEYTFIELFDVLKEGEYADPVDGGEWQKQGINSDGGIYALNDDLTEYEGSVAIFKDDFKIKYIIKKKPKQNPPKKEGKCSDAYGVNGEFTPDPGF